MTLQQRNQLLMRQQETKAILKEIHPVLQVLKSKVQKLESEYGRCWNIYMKAEAKLAKERTKYIPTGKSGSHHATTTQAAIRKFAAMPRKKQLELLAALEKSNAKSEVHQVR